MKPLTLFLRLHASVLFSTEWKAASYDGGTSRRKHGASAETTQPHQA